MVSPAPDGRAPSDRFPDAGHTFLLGLFTERRTRHFRPLAAARIVEEALARADRDALTRTLAYCVSPDRVQWLLILGDFTSLARPVHEVKLNTERALASLIMPAGPVWQPAFARERIVDVAEAERIAREITARPPPPGVAGRMPAWIGTDTSAAEPSGFGEAGPEVV